ncbi:hypothetical protein B0H13DRAFT_1898278 [Mycena leptocephala]|nr:hypothetical protein B0H13DRAFT_1898278 [Mycena leptocephala]
MTGCGVDKECTTNTSSTTLMLGILFHRIRSSRPLQAVLVRRRSISNPLREIGMVPRMEDTLLCYGDVLSTYSKTWEKISNIRASQDLISAKIDLVRQTGELFSHPSSIPRIIERKPDGSSTSSGVVTSMMTKKSRFHFHRLAISHPRIASDRLTQPRAIHQTRTGGFIHVTGGATTSRDLQMYNGESGPSHEAGTYGEDPATSNTRRDVEFLKTSAKINCVHVDGVARSLVRSRAKDVND